MTFLDWLEAELEKGEDDIDIGDWGGSNLEEMMRRRSMLLLFLIVTLVCLGVILVIK